MSARKQITTSEAAQPVGPYAQAVAAGGLVFIAGQGPFSPTGERIGESFAEQLRATLDNLETIANAAGTSLSHAVRMGAYLDDLANFAEFNAILRETLQEPYPARTTIQADLPGFAVEIDVVLALPEAE